MDISIQVVRVDGYFYSSGVGGKFDNLYALYRYMGPGGGSSFCQLSSWKMRTNLAEKKIKTNLAGKIRTNLEEKKIRTNLAEKNRDKFT